MKLWYSATEVRLQQMDADLNVRKAELDHVAEVLDKSRSHAAELQRKDVAYDTLSQNSTRELNDYKLLAEKQRVVDLAAGIVDIRNQYVEKLEKAEEIVGAEGRVRREVRGGDSPWTSFERHGHI